MLMPEIFSRHVSLFERLAAIANRLYMTLENGSIVCMEEKYK
jgi:hypothetical protein